MNKKVLLFLILIFLSVNSPVNAAGVSGREWFINSKYPLDTAKTGGLNNPTNEIIDDFGKGRLKVGISKRINILGLVEIGDSGICRAMKRGNIRKIHYVDYSFEKVYIPIYIPIYFNRSVTTVYGE
jgi:hypothetical protein